MPTMLKVSGDRYYQSPSGCQCVFLKFGNKGIKVYRDRDERDLSYANQFRLASMGLAPKCYFKAEIEVEGRNGNPDWHGYAFETELAEVKASVIKPEKPSWNEDDGNQAEWDCYRKKSRRFESAISGLKAKLEDAGCRWVDDHSGNIGFLADGTAVIIDCADNLFTNGRVGRDCFED